MALVINTNIASLNAQRNLGRSQGSLNTSMERLSSGLRINSAKDDAAGLAISDRMTAQIRGLNQASRNANDGISMAQTAEGALQESTNILQRIRELAVQSANDTNSASDRESLDQEVQQLKAELDRIASTTEFNGRKVIDGSMSDATFQVGPNAGEQQTISFSIDSARSADLSDVGTVIEAPSGNPVVGTNVSGTSALAAGDLIVNNTPISATASGSAIDIAAAINDAVDEDNPIATAQNTQTINFNTINLDEDNSTAVMAPTSTVDGVASSILTVARPAVQTMDMSSTTVAAGETLDFTVAGESFTYTNSGAVNLSGADLVSDIAAKFGTRDVGGTAGEYTFSQDGSTASQLNITQAAGNESEITTQYTTTNSTTVSAPTATETVSYSAGGTQAVGEQQTLDLSTTTLLDGETFTLVIDSNNFTYTNTTGSALSGSSLAAELATNLPTSVGVSGDYSFAADLLTNTQLNISQDINNASDIAAITTANSSTMVNNPSATLVDIVDGSPYAAGSLDFDLSAVTVANGDTLTFTVTNADSSTETIVYTNDNSGTDLSGANLAADIQQDLLGRPDYQVTAAAGVLTFAQQPGYYQELSTTTTDHTAVNSGGGSTDGSNITAGATGSEEFQSIEFSSTVVEAGQTLVFSIDGNATALTYTNNTSGNLTGADLVADIAAQLDGSIVTGGTNANNAMYSFTQNMVAGSGTSRLDIEQMTGPGTPNITGDIATIATVGGQAAATAPTATDNVVQGVAGAVTPSGPQAQVQALDLSVTTLEAGATLTLTIGDGVNPNEDIIFTNTRAEAVTGADLVADIAARFGTRDVGGTYGDYIFSQDVSTNTTLNITQAPGSEANMNLITTANSSSVTSPTATIIEAGNAEVQGPAAQSEKQSFDFAGRDVADGRTVDITIGGSTITYTNTSGSTLSGADLVADIASHLGTTDMGNALGEYVFAQDAGTTTTLNISQAAGNESDIGPISITTQGTVEGTYSLQLNGNSLNLTEAIADSTVTAEEVAAAINNVTGFTATTNEDGAVVITNEDATSFTLQEYVDINGSAPLEEDGTGFENVVSTAASTFEGQISLDSTTDIVLSGDALEAVGLSEVGNVTTTIDQVTIITREDAWVAIESVDAALTDIDTIRGGLGAVQNRFISTISNLDNVAENLSAARSRILDADIAMESSNMTKQNILQQAGVSILTQANQSPQLALSLLQG